MLSTAAVRHGGVPPFAPLPMPTLRIALEEFFVVRERPYLSKLITRALAEDAGTSAQLDLPLRELLTSDDVLRLVAPLPLARIVTAAELRTPGEQRQRFIGPVLSDNACAWLLQANGDIAALTAGLLASSIVCPESDAEIVRSSRKRLLSALAPVAAGWPVDIASIVRVGRLLIAQHLRHHVVASSIANAALLMLPRSGWHAIHDACGLTSREWTSLLAAYGALRAWVDSLTPFALDRLVVALWFPRDALVPMPVSGLVADVQATAPALGFSWPGRKGAPSHDPLLAVPSPVDAGALVTHVPVPSLALHGRAIPLQTELPPGPPLPAVVGATSADGGCAQVLQRAVEAFGFGLMLRDQGHDADELIRFACGARSVAPVARRDAPAAAPVEPLLATDALRPAPERVVDDLTPAPSVIVPRVPRTHEQILAARRFELSANHSCTELADKNACLTHLFATSRRRSLRSTSSAPSQHSSTTRRRRSLRWSPSSIGCWRCSRRSGRRSSPTPSRRALTPTRP